MPDRIITIGAQDAGAFELLDKIKQSSTEIYDKVIQKAEQYSSKLSQQAERAKNIIDREKELQRVLAEEHKEMLQSERDRKMAQLDPKDSAFSQKRKELVNEYGDAIKDVNHEMRDFSATMNEVSRKSSEHFQKSKEAGGGMGRMGAGFGQGAIAGGVTGFMTGGGLGGLASTLVGGGLGMIPLIGSGAAILGGGITGALFQQGQRAAESEHRLLAATGQTAVPDLTRFGIDRATTMQQQRQLAQMAGTRNVVGDIGAIRGLEMGMGVNQGALNPLVGLRQMGVKDEAQDMMTQFLTLAVASDLWNVDSKDFSAMPREIQNLTSMLQSASQVMVNPDAQQAMFLRASFAGMGELFAGGRGQGIMMGIHGGIQNPSNQFQQAMTLEAIIRSRPEIGGGAVGFGRARAIQARGIHEPGTFEAIMEQVRQSTQDPFMRQMVLISKFEHLRPFLESKELKALVSAPKGTFAGQDVDAVSKELKKIGWDQDKMNALFNVTEATKTDQLNAKILTELQHIGEVVTEKTSKGVLDLVDLVKNDFIPMMQDGLDEIADLLKP